MRCSNGEADTFDKSHDIAVQAHTLLGLMGGFVTGSGIGTVFGGSTMLVMGCAGLLIGGMCAVATAPVRPERELAPASQLAEGGAHAVKEGN